MQSQLSLMDTTMCRNRIKKRLLNGSEKVFIYTTMSTAMISKLLKNSYINECSGCKMGQDKNYCKNKCRYYKQIEKERES